MSNGNLPLGTIHDIKIRINWSWIIIFVLVMWSLAVGYFPAHFKNWSELEYWLVGAAAAALLFVSVLIHELSHSFVAQARGLPVSSITLYIFGGISNITKEPASAGEEFAIAFAGPLSSLLLGGVFIGLYYAVRSPQWLYAIFGYLGVINIILAVFNLIPAFPLDGGRVFRSIVWAIRKDLRESTYIATLVGQFFAWLFILFGIWQAIAGSFITGIWLAFIGWFLHNAATASYRQAIQSVEFRNVDVGDVMTKNPPTISPETTLATVVYQHLLQGGQRALPVTEDGHLLGLLTISDVRHFAPEQWPVIKTWRAMTPVERLDTVTPQTHLIDAISLMAQHGHNQLPVVQDGQLVGMISRANIVHYLQMRHELGLDRQQPNVPTGTSAGRSVE
jgi:Zn-dependent protease/predicted transcriptional regulator